MDSVLEVIRKSAISKNLVNIDYIDSKGILSSRSVEPYEIKNNKLYAYCTDKDSMRAFTLSNITKATFNETEFSPKWPIKIM